MRRFPRLPSTLLCCLLGGVMASGCGHAQTAESAGAPLGSVRVGTTAGRAVPPSFMGLSHEWLDGQWMMGDSATGPNLIYRRLLMNLTAYGSGPMSLRIGGNSTDLVGKPTAHTVKPLAEVAETVGARFILGVNLGSGNPELAAEQVKAFLREMPPGSVEAIEIGNEPDLYARNGMRSRAYSAREYFADFELWKKQIAPLLPGGIKLAGPGWASTGMLGALRGNPLFDWKAMAAITQHYYAGDPAKIGSDDFLLRPEVATLGPAAVASTVATAHAHGTEFRMDEFNSLDDRGAHGVSDGFGAALWAIDTMFEYVRVGVDGVNWESSRGNFDNPFSFKTHTSGGVDSFTLTAVSPLYYGLLFFQEATANRARMLPVELNTGANLKAWATVDAAGTTRLVLINKDQSASGRVEVSLSGYSRATVLRLEAPSYKATSGVTLAGQTFDGSVDGTIRGQKRTEEMRAQHGIFAIPMPATSAALVIFSN